MAVVSVIQHGNERYNMNDKAIAVVHRRLRYIKYSYCMRDQNGLHSFNLWYLTFFVYMPLDVIALQLYTPKAVGV
jgi:hypothetical protein